MCCYYLTYLWCIIVRHFGVCTLSVQRDVSAGITQEGVNAGAWFYCFFAPFPPAVRAFSYFREGFGSPFPSATVKSEFVCTHECTTDTYMLVLAVTTTAAGYTHASEGVVVERPHYAAAVHGSRVLSMPRSHNHPPICTLWSNARLVHLQLFLPLRLSKTGQDPSQRRYVADMSPKIL